MSKHPMRKPMLPPLPSETRAGLEAAGAVPPMSTPAAQPANELDQVSAQVAAPTPVPQAEGFKTELTKPAPAAKVEKTKLGKTPAYELSHKIVIYAPANPKRGGTAGWARFEVYRDGMTAEEYMKHPKIGGFGRADISWDLQRHFIKLVPADTYEAELRVRDEVRAGKKAEAAPTAEAQPKEESSPAV